MQHLIHTMIPAVLIWMMMLHATARGESSSPPLVVGVAQPDPARQIRAETIVNAPAADVWTDWTTSEGVTGFLETPSAIEPRLGGKYEIYFVPDAPEGQRGSEGCTVLSWLPRRMLSFSWSAPPTFPSVRDGAEKTIVVVELFPIAPELTKVTLTHHGWPAADAKLPNIEEWNGTFEYFKKAWPNVLQALAARHAPKDGAAAPDPRNGWVYLVSPVREDLLSTMTDDEKKHLSAHAQYIKDLTTQGVVICAGPCTDMKAPGIVIFQAKDEAAARAIMENDAAVKNGVFRAELHPMRLSFLRGRD
jgi:uncharacterized protein YndB with AHSA1/START domain/uncharacterized protein YciI